jgi:hypothetical protein
MWCGKASLWPRGFDGKGFRVLEPCPKEGQKWREKAASSLRSVRETLQLVQRFEHARRFGFRFSDWSTVDHYPLVLVDFGLVEDALTGRRVDLSRFLWAIPDVADCTMYAERVMPAWLARRSISSI